jgi:tetratricopeptide (TPR) repeat protein
MKKYKYSKNPEEHFQNGLSKYDFKDYKGALSDFTFAIELKKNYPEAYFMRGILYGKELQKFNKAIKEFSQAIKLKPDYADAYYNRGVTYRILDKFQKAFDDWKKAEELGSEMATSMIQKYGSKYNLS